MNHILNRHFLGYPYSVFITAFFLGFLALVIRLWFIGYAVNSYPFDTSLYDRLARSILKDGVTIEPEGRSFSYPFFVAGIYKISGIGNTRGVQYAQVLLDSLTTILIFTGTLAVSKNRLAATASGILYAVNPVSASYTGMVLSETLTSFATMLVVLTVIRRKMMYWLFGMTMALLTSVRMIILPQVIITLVAVSMVSNKDFRNKFTSFVLAIMGFICIFIIPIAVTYTVKRTLFPVKPESNRFFLAMGSKVHEWPELYKDMKPVPKEFHYWDFDDRPPHEFRNYTDKLFTKFISETFQDPIRYFAYRWIHMAIMVNKTHLFYYEDPFHSVTRIAIPVVNGIFLFLALIGFVGSIKLKDARMKRFVVMSFLLYVLSLVIFSLGVPEERRTVQFYVMTSIFGGIGISYLIRIMHPAPKT